MYNSQDIAKQIKDVAKQKNKRTGVMLEECQLSKNALSSMNSGYMPQLENLVKIADYLEVSVDLLLGRTKYLYTPENIKNNAPDNVRSVILSKIISLPDSRLDRLLGFLEGLEEE